MALSLRAAANGAFAAAATAERAAKIPTKLQQLNKRAVHRAMEIMGARAAIGN